MLPEASRHSGYLNYYLYQQCTCVLPWLFEIVQHTSTLSTLVTDTLNSIQP